MNKSDIMRIAANFMEQTPANRIAKEDALSPEIVGMKLFDAPIFGFAAAQDETFYRLKASSAVGDHMMLPKDWLPEAKTVISFFLPFTEDVRNSNRLDMDWPSNGWLHGRIEGHAALVKLCIHLKDELSRMGYQSRIPALEERFWSNTDRQTHPQQFTSNWSERHTAFVCSLGTFGLSGGLITRNGIAGRFGSIITDLSLEPDVRNYEDPYAYCTMCGKCALNCPAGAISLETGKNHQICSDFLKKTKEKHITRYACGKCQVAVPCETRIPIRS